MVASSHTFGSWHTGALASSADQLAAMPSLHIAWACWCALAVWRMTSRPALRVLAVLYPCLTAVIVCATGNHFLFDVLGGAAAMALSVWLVEIAPRLLRGVGRAAALR